MNKEPEKGKEKSKIKQDTKNPEHDRNSVKKSTLSLSEIPDIIKDELNFGQNIKKSMTNIMTKEKGSLYPIKLRNSFINDTIKFEKDETPSSLAEIKKLLEIEKREIKDDKDKKNIPITKREKEKNVRKFLSKKTNTNESKIHLSKKKLKSSKQTMFNNLETLRNKDKDKDKDKEKYMRYKSRKSDLTRTINKNKIFLAMTDSPKKKMNRKSIISQPNVSPTKIYTTEIFKKFFLKKNSFEEKEKRNEDKIYINIPNKEEELLITVNTTQETIKNYYEYMQDCFQIIDSNFNKNIKLQPIEPINFQFKKNKKTVVFELESTLVSYYIENLNLDNENNNTLGINIRPHLKQSLDLIKNNYNIVIYSSGSKNYVDAILDFIDPEHDYFNFRLYRNHCNKFIINNKIYFTKNLNIFKNICPLKDIVMVDCSVIGFGFFLENGIPIIPYYDSKEDVELMLVSYYLLSIASNNDLRIALKRDIELNYYFQKAREKNNDKDINIINDLKRENTNISPETAQTKRKRESKTYKFTNYIHIYKRNSHSLEEKKNKKTSKGSKKKKKLEKEEDNKYISPKKDKESVKKKKIRKYTANSQKRNFLYIRSPKISSREKTKKTDGKRNFIKNK
jgi:hypothetical protein